MSWKVVVLLVTSPFWFPLVALVAGLALWMALAFAGFCLDLLRWCWDDVRYVWSRAMRKEDAAGSITPSQNTTSS